MKYQGKSFNVLNQMKFFLHPTSEFFPVRFETIGKQVLLTFMYSEAAYPIWQLSLSSLLFPAATLFIAFSLLLLRHGEGGGGANKV